jgi:hypothetical protein
MTRSGYRSIAGGLSRTKMPLLHHRKHKHNHHFLIYDKKWLSKRCWWWLFVKKIDSLSTICDAISTMSIHTDAMIVKAL